MIRTPVLSVLFTALLASTASAEIAPEPLTSASYPPLSAHRVHILSYEGGVMNRYFVIDGDNAKMLGMVPGAMYSGLRIGADGHFYSSDTFYDKIVRGNRTDQITVFDGKSGALLAETTIPAKRQLSYTVNSSFDFTSDGSYLLQYNFAPAGSVTVYDSASRKVVGEIPSAGCGLVFPYAPTAFAMLCADGGLLRVTFNGKGESKREQVKPFFDPENDPVLQNSLAVPEKQLGLFITYEGMVHEVNLAGPELYHSQPWSLRAKGEEEWFPSGWQPFAYSSKLDRLYVVMHKGAKWEHTDGGHDIWVYDLKSKKRVQQLHFEAPIWNVTVSPDDKPQLYALSSEEGILYIVDGTSGKTLHEMEELGSYPFALVPVPAMALK